ncbi:MAG: phage terminase large subunit [Capsulimonadaceae bacterium]|nr:phage terminase large subunit [Capsulimonadaceae bacterium]
MRDFVRWSWDVLEPETPLQWNWHIDAICDHKEAQFFDWLAIRKALKKGETPPPMRMQNLVMNVPPGSTKSRIMMVDYPAWVWLHAPTWHGICVSSAKLATRDSLLTRRLIESDWYQEWFQPEWGFTADQNAKLNFINTLGGQREAITPGASIVGNRGDELLMDDLNDPDDENESAKREQINDWWDMGAGNRLNDLRYSMRSMIQQRMHHEDATGHFTQSMEWVKVVIPMEFEPSRATKTPIGWIDPRMISGELMFPARFPASVIEQEKKRLGTYGYQGQYQQEPSPPGGSIFKESWFGSYKSLPAMKEVWTAWDTALKTKEENDESALVTIGLGEDGNLYVLRMWHGREETPDIARRLIQHAGHLRQLYGDRYRGDYIEDAPGGTALMQYLRRTSSALAVIPIRAATDKVSRAHVVSPICEAGRVLLPDPWAYAKVSGWRRDLLANLTSFPKASHDDITDAFVYAVKRFMSSMGTGKSRRGTAGGWV